MKIPLDHSKIPWKNLQLPLSAACSMRWTRSGAAPWDVFAQASAARRCLGESLEVPLRYPVGLDRRSESCGKTNAINLLWGWFVPQKWWTWGCFLALGLPRYIKCVCCIMFPLFKLGVRNQKGDLFKPRYFLFWWFGTKSSSKPQPVAPVGAWKCSKWSSGPPPPVLWYYRSGSLRPRIQIKNHYKIGSSAPNHFTFGVAVVVETPQQKNPKSLLSDNSCDPLNPLGKPWLRPPGQRWICSLSSCPHWGWHVSLPAAIEDRSHPLKSEISRSSVGLGWYLSKHQKLK